MTLPITTPFTAAGGTRRTGLGLRHALAAVAIAALGACASAPQRNAALDAARANYDRVAADPQVVRSAPLELRKAQQALQAADAALKSGADATTVEHQAYLAQQRTRVAQQAGVIATADQAVTNASLERDRILIDSRTTDADQQRARAEAARGQAEKARADAEAARKVAEERLAAAQASQARAAAAQAQAQTAQAQAKSLEAQLADLKAKKTDRGMVLTLGDVLFDTGRAELNAGAARTLDQLAAFMKDNPERSIQIEGYTDSVGSDQYNQVLSERRANAVKNALADRGVMPNRVTARGFGEASPVASNDNAAGRQQNRRVEIVFVGTT